ncbi:MAG: M28 family peptidase, partial [Bacteroidales bacterium]|nr:M28 family peptidase [Bacteroidales bacterium]
CLHRTTMGNPHYLNDVAESYYHYLSATNKSFVATGMGRPDALKPVHSVTGSRDPFYYSINAHYGASDHEVFNDWGVQVPGVIMITWPDNYYHTSGDRPEICDPTQLHRAIVLAAVSAYTIAEAGEEGAVKIASEVAANSSKRMAIKMRHDLSLLNAATAENFAQLYRTARFNQDAMMKNELATLATVQELAPASAALKGYITTLQEGVKAAWTANGKSIDAAMKVKASALGVAPVKAIVLSAEEKAAAKVFPRSTAKVKETGYGVLRTVSADLMKKYGFEKRGAVNYGGEIAKLTVGGTNSILDIKKMLDAQFPNPDSLETVTKYLEMLKEAGLVNY